MEQLPWCLHLTAYFQSLQLTAHSPTGLRFFCPFLGQIQPALYDQGKTPEQRHGRAQARVSMEEQWRWWCGSLWCYGMEPIQLQRGRLAGPSGAFLPRCLTMGSLEWGPVGCTHSSIKACHSPLWLPSRWTRSYAGWRWGFVPAVSTVEPIFLRKQLSDIWVCARSW